MERKMIGCVDERMNGAFSGHNLVDCTGPGTTWANEMKYLGYESCAVSIARIVDLQSSARLGVQIHYVSHCWPPLNS